MGIFKLVEHHDQSLDCFLERGLRIHPFGDANVVDGLPQSHVAQQKDLRFTNRRVSQGASDACLHDLQFLFDGGNRRIESPGLRMDLGLVHFSAGHGILFGAATQQSALPGQAERGHFARNLRRSGLRVIGAVHQVKRLCISPPSSCCQGLGKIFPQIGNILNAHRDAHQAVADTGALALIRSHGAV